MEMFHSLGLSSMVAASLGLLGMIAIGGVALGRHLGESQDEPTTLQNRPQQPSEESRFAEARRRMVERQLRSRDIIDVKVLDAMGRIPRHRFVPTELQKSAYDDCALPIAESQTISQPYIVALMTQMARLTPRSRVLEIGAGSGYQAAVLADLAKEVYSIEILKPLADNARDRLNALGYKNVTIRCGDGYQGWAEHAPYDAILVTAAPDHVPQPLEEQLAVGGRLILPLGRYAQKLMLLEKRPDGKIHRETIIPVMFVPMTGEAEHHSP
jgi:protein-L-isoaspartate(D-aspartate) O-methyltransferase